MDNSTSKRAKFKCIVCGTEFETWKYRNPTCCSRKCASSLSRGVPKLTSRKPENFRTIYCEVCSKEYVVHVSQIQGRNSRCCSKKCLSEWMVNHHTGQNNPMYSGGRKYPDRGANWSTQRKHALKRDGRKCQICNTDKKKARISVHHIKPYKDFSGDYLKANEITNLITLCQKCHNAVEHYGLPCPKKML